VVGVVAAGVYVLASLIFSRVFQLEAQWATGVAVIVSAVVSYLGHYYLTFQVQGHHHIHGTRFTMQLLVVLVLNTLFIKIAHDHFMMPLWLATSAFAVFMPVGNFIIYQAFTFRQQRSPS
jgi:putative flippase GtrA